MDDLRNHAVKNPAKIALVTADGSDRRTYAELDAAADAIARWFQSIGLKPRDTIALLLENRLEVAEIWWGARRAGVYFAPLSTHFREEEISYVLRDCDARLLITSPRFTDTANSVMARLEPGDRPHLAMLDTAAPGFALFAPLAWTDLPEAPHAEVFGREFIYSSGTTGRPKGVRRALAPYPATGPIPFFEQVVRSMFKSGEDIVYLSTSPLYHSIGRFLMRTMEAGGTGVVMAAFDAEQALSAIERFRVTHAIPVPTMFVRMLALPEETRGRYDVSSLQLVLHGAAPCSVPVKLAMLEWWGPVVDEFYGGTENAGLTHITAAEWLERRGSVGRSVAGKVHILSEDGSETELPPGEIGMIYFEGAVPFTYHNDAEKSQSAFSSQGWGTYGDIGHVDADGYVFLSDRRNDLIISGGVNIYPSEVELTMIDHPAVAEVAVFGIADPEYGQTVAAAVKAAPGAEPSEQLASQIIAWTRERLSHLKCPRAVHFLDALPANEHGKILKRVLRDRYAPASAE